MLRNNSCCLGRNWNCHCLRRNIKIVISEETDIQKNKEAMVLDEITKLLMFEDEKTDVVQLSYRQLW